MFFVVTGGRSWSFKTLNLEVFKTKLETLFVYISTTLCTDSVVAYASLDQIWRINSIRVIQNLQFFEKVSKTNVKNLLSYISINLSYGIKVY